jgi:hypothetical protein
MMALLVWKEGGHWAPMAKKTFDWIDTDNRLLLIRRSLIVRSYCTG